MAQARKTLLRAANYASGLEKASNLDEAEEKWNAYLVALDSVWDKIKSEYGRHPDWKAFKAKYGSIRASDPLLSYLHEARNTDVHTIGEIVRQENGGIAIRNAEPGPTIIDSMRIENGVITELKSPHKLKIETVPGALVPLDVSDRKKTYPVPSTHLGNPIDPVNVQNFAKLGLVYYEDFVDKAEKAFT